LGSIKGSFLTIRFSRRTLLHVVSWIQLCIKRCYFKFWHTCSCCLLWSVCLRLLAHGTQCTLMCPVFEWKVVLLVRSSTCAGRGVRIW